MLVENLSEVRMDYVLLFLQVNKLSLLIYNQSNTIFKNRVEKSIGNGFNLGAVLDCLERCQIVI